MIFCHACGRAYGLGDQDCPACGATRVSAWESRMPCVRVIPPHTEETYRIWDAMVDDPENALDGWLYRDGELWVSRERLRAWREGRLTIMGAAA